MNDSSQVRMEQFFQSQDLPRAGSQPLNLPFAVTFRFYLREEFLRFIVLLLYLLIPV